MHSGSSVRAVMGPEDAEGTAALAVTAAQALLHRPCCILFLHSRAAFVVGHCGTTSHTLYSMMGCCGVDA
jgi:hypothetical protein